MPYSGRGSILVQFLFRGHFSAWIELKYNFEKNNKNKKATQAGELACDSISFHIFVVVTFFFTL